MVIPDVLLTAILSIFLFLTLCGALALIVVSLRRPSAIPLYVASGLIVLCLLVVVVFPVNVPVIVGLVIALLGVSLAVLGRQPRHPPHPQRRHARPRRRRRQRRNHAAGRPAIEGQAVADSPVREVLRGGTTIGYLERLAVAIAIVAGYPEAIAIVVAVKGIGRFSELAAAEARERFIIGTLASLLWACIVGGLDPARDLVIRVAPGDGIRSS